MTDKKQKDIPTVAEKTDRWVIEPEQFDFVLNKVSKISTVLYKLSDSLSDNEPLKWHLRGQASQSVLDIALAQKGVDTEKYRALSDVKRTLLGSISLCELATFCGYFSQMNMKILREEITQMVFFTEQFLLPIDSRFSTELFYVPRVDNTEKERTKNKSFSQGHIKDNRIADMRKGQKYLPDSSLLMSDRQTKIIDILRQKGNASIKDIAKEIKGCSEKTVQRELGLLVSGGVLSKEGERRWSRYSVVE